MANLKIVHGSSAVQSTDRSGSAGNVLTFIQNLPVYVSDERTGVTVECIKRL